MTKQRTEESSAYKRIVVFSPVTWRTFPIEHGERKTVAAIDLGLCRKVIADNETSYLVNVDKAVEACLSVDVKDYEIQKDDRLMEITV